MARSTDDVDEIMKNAEVALLRCYSDPPHVATLNRKEHKMDLSCSPLLTLQSILPDHTWAYKVLTHAPDRREGVYVGPFSNDFSNFQQDQFVVVQMQHIVDGCIAQLQTHVPVTADMSYDFRKSEPSHLLASSMHSSA